MFSRPFRCFSAGLSLLLWLAMLLAPWIDIQGEDALRMVEVEHNEHESEGEEWQSEWEESLLSLTLDGNSVRVNWHGACLLNVGLHERLDASRSLDPPDA